MCDMYSSDFSASMISAWLRYFFSVSLLMDSEMEYTLRPEFA